jgi:hypothetical protein
MRSSVAVVSIGAVTVSSGTGLGTHLVIRESLAAVSELEFDGQR